MHMHIHTHTHTYACKQIDRGWSFDEVCEWLEANDVYSEFIVDNELDGADMLELTVGDLGADSSIIKFILRTCHKDLCSIVGQKD